MRNTKLWSVLLAAVLLCACVVGVLFVGAQAEGTAYTWTVDGVGTATDSYATIDAAMIAADAKAWAAGDTLTISVTAETTSTFNTTNVGGQANTGRNLFNIRTIFRADNTKLPITIDGGESKVALNISTPVWTVVSKKSFAATNDYTFKNLNLSSWGNSAYTFYAGAGMVTFENVDFGTTQSMIITPAVGGWTPFVSSWNVEKFNANAASDGLLETGFIFKNTNYGKTNGTLTCRSCDTGISGSGAAVNDLTIMNTMLRNKIVIGEGSTVANINHHSVTDNSIKTLSYAPAESVIEVDGGSITNVYSVRGAYSGVGNKLVFNMKSGSVKYLRMGPNGDAGKFTGDLELNYTGGTVTELRAAYKGTIEGDVTFNAKGVDFAWGDCSIVGSTVTGTLYNTIEDCTLTGQLYMGAKAANVVNTLKGTIETGDNYAYFGTNSANLTGNITNNIAATIDFTGDATEGYFYGGSNGGSVAGTITNNILPGAEISDLPFVAGNNTNTAGAIVNNMSGGHIATFYAAHGINNATALASVTNTLTGGIVDLFAGASSEGANANKGSVAKVVNNLGKVEEDGSYSGNVWVKKFYAGAYAEATPVGEIENNYYSGTIGCEDRADEKTWFADNANYVGFGGSNKGTVGKITNKFYGGIFNVGYFYCGNAADTASFGDTLYTLQEGESRINNYVYGGHFARFCGGSKAGSALSIANYIQGVSHDSITDRQGAFYCAIGADANTDVYNEVSGFAPVSLPGNAGDFNADLSAASTQIVGGNNNQNVQSKSVTNVLKNGVEIKYFYSGCNSGLQPKMIENYIYDAKIDTFYGGNATNSYSAEMTSIKTTLEKGEIRLFIGGFNKAEVGLKIGSIENNIKGGKITTFYGGHYSAYNSNGKGEITSITNNITGGEFTTFVAGCYEAVKTAAAAEADVVYAIGAINNNIGSDSIETRPVINGNFYGGCQKELNAKNEAGFYSYYEIAAINNTIDYAFFGNSAYLGTRYHTVQNITNVINNMEIEGSVLCLANNVGKIYGTVDSTINGLTLINATLVPDVNSSSCVVGDDVVFAITIAEGAKINVNKAGGLNLKGNFPSKGTHTVNVTNFELNQIDYWADGVTYLTAAEGTVPASAITVVDNVAGEAVVSNDSVVGKSTLAAVEANMILTERVAVRIVFDKAVATEYAAENLVALVGTKNVKIEIDPTNENAVIIYGIGVKDFGKMIKFEGLFPALADDKDTIIELSDYAATILENNKIYKAIADFGRVAAGKAATYGLTPYEVNNKAQAPTANTGFVTGKNLIMSDALGFRYYATLAEEQSIEDIKVYVEGTDYTEYCNIAFVGESNVDITIDFYLTIKIMSAPIDVKIVVGEETALEYVEYGNAIAAKIIEKQPDNALAKAALVYIQAASKL